MCYEQVSTQIGISQQELETERRKNLELQRQNACMTANLSDMEHMIPRGNNNTHVKDIEKSHNDLKYDYEKAASNTTSLDELVDNYRKEVLELKNTRTVLHDKTGREQQQRNTSHLSK